jgi:ferrochelatase
MYHAGARNAIGFIAAAHHCYSSCQQYRENVADARASLRSATGGDVSITYVKSWFDHSLFIQAYASHVREALWRLPTNLRMSAQLVFTAHSIPTSMAEVSRYEDQLMASSQAVAAEVGLPWALVYQSRSGRPDDPWLEPDVCDYLGRQRAAGLQAAILCPIGFVCDHIEVLYDLDREAADVCRETGLTMVRAEAVNDDPLFLDMMADVVIETLDWYEGGRPLPIAAR